MPDLRDDDNDDYDAHLAWRAAGYTPLPVAPTSPPPIIDPHKIQQRILCGCGRVHVEDLRYDHRYTAMHCMQCGKALRLDLLTHHHEREYFCPEHCRATRLGQPPALVFALSKLWDGRVDIPPR